MKKWLLILAVGMTAVSCTWWHETFDDVKECEEWYLEELAKAKDLDKFEEIYNDYTAWRNELGWVDKLKADEVFGDWIEDNEDEWADIGERRTKVYDKYKYTPKDEDKDEDENEEYYNYEDEVCCAAEVEECCVAEVEECCVAEVEECYVFPVEKYESFYDYEDEYEDFYYDYEDEYEDFYYDYEDEYFYY